MEQVSSLQSKSSPCGASLLLVEQVFKDLKLSGQVWAFVLLWAPHKEWALTSLRPWTWACWARQALSHILSFSLTEFQNLLHNLDKFTCEVLNIKWKNDFKVLEFVLHFATDSFA